MKRTRITSLHPPLPPFTLPCSTFLFHFLPLFLQFQKKRWIKKKNSKTYQTCGGKINLEGEKKKERRRDRSVRNYQRNCTQYKFSGERGTIEKNFRDKPWKKKKGHWTERSLDSFSLVRDFPQKSRSPSITRVSTLRGLKIRNNGGRLKSIERSDETRNATTLLKACTRCVYMYVCVCVCSK